MFLEVKHASPEQHILRSWVCIFIFPNVTTLSFHWVIRQFTFNVITDIDQLESAILVFAF